METLIEKQNIIVMGGSFNPPTIAHLKIIRAAMDAVNAEKGYLVPVGYAYLKRKMMKAGEGHMCITDAVRLTMLEKMCKEDPRIVLYTEEMKEPFAVTYATMSHIQDLYPDANIFFVAGTDKIGLIEEFARKNDFLERFRIAVFARNNEDPLEEIRSYEKLLPYIDSFVVIDQPEGIEQISSTAVRRHLFDIDAVANMLHPDVVPILKKLDPSEFPKEIVQFKDEYAFLDNCFPADISYEGLIYPSAESAFQASRLIDNKERMPFTTYKQDKVKQKGYYIEPYDGWEAKRLEIMEKILREKFRQHLDLYEKLLQTRGYKLIAGNKKKEKYWGVNLITWEGDRATYEKIMAADNPKDYKAMGRLVKNFIPAVWDANKLQIVVTGNIAKFSQNAAIREFLLGTSDKVLVEASPYDGIWGVKLGMDDPKIQDPNNWEGENLLGCALMETRDILREKQR